MKIALVSQEYPPETARGGIGSQTYMKAQGLSSLGHEVYVISRSIHAKRYELREDRICVIRIPGMEGSLPDMTEPIQWLTYSACVAVEIAALNARTPLDIIDFPEWGAEGYVHLLNRSEWNKIPAVIQLHGPLIMFAHTMGWPEMNSEFYRIGTHMEETCIQLADAVFSSSDCSTRWVLNHYHPQKETIPTLHMGVDTTLFAPRPVPKHDRLTILFVGSIVNNKGVENLVEAACDLIKEFPDLRLRMIGRGEQKVIERLREKAESHGMPELLDLAGFVGKQNLPDELSRAHVFAAPSLYEGGPGFVFLEAMACGLPVVGCSGSGVDEIIKSGENGFLVPPNDSKALTEVIRKLLTDDDLSSSMRKSARNYIEQEADSRICIERLEDFYKSVVSLKESRVIS